MPDKREVYEALKKTTAAQRRIILIFRRATRSAVQQKNYLLHNLKRNQIARQLGRPNGRLYPHDIKSLEMLCRLGLVNRTRIPIKGAIGYEFVYWMTSETDLFIRELAIEAAARKLQRTIEEG